MALRVFSAYYCVLSQQWKTPGCFLLWHEGGAYHQLTQIPLDILRTEEERAVTKTKLQLFRTVVFNLGSVDPWRAQTYSEQSDRQQGKSNFTHVKFLRGGDFSELLDS